MKKTAEEMLSERLEARADPKKHQLAAPAGYRLRGVSTMVNKAGEPVLTWVKTAVDHADPLELAKVFKEVCEHVAIPRAEAVPVSGGSVDSLLTVYPMGDPHLGLLSWPAETGQDSTLALGVQILSAAVDRLVSLAPASRAALIINLGDFFHADNYEARTARSGHALDVDSRWPKVLRAGLWTMISLVRRALVKHETVHVINMPGNHDDHSAIMLAVAMQAHFCNEPRVRISESPAIAQYHEFGKVLIGTTHGHTLKADKLPGEMASQQPEAWGRTRFRYWYTGHLHHEIKKEYPGVIVETFRTLAAQDAWHAAHGYHGGRSMVCDVHHRERGRIMRHEVGVESLEVE